MPAAATGSNGGNRRAVELTAQLGVDSDQSLLQALREVKNQIIGNRTKKLLYLSLGAVPKIVTALAASLDSGNTAIAVQSAAALGSFACGVDDGALAVLHAGAIPQLVRAISFPEDKVMDAGARSLRIIFQSKLAPKFDIFQENNMTFLKSLLSNNNENVIQLASSVIAHSCNTNSEQMTLCTTGILKRLFTLLEGSLNRKDAVLDSITAIITGNNEVIGEFVCLGNGKTLAILIQLMKDKHPRTRLLACMCLNAICNMVPCYVQGLQIKTKMLLVLIELLEETDRVGDDALFALSDLILGKEELHKQELLENAVEKLCSFLTKGVVHSRRLQGILLALAAICSESEKCRCKVVTIQVLNIISNALKHESTDVGIAACTCLKSLSRSVQNLSAGSFSTEAVVVSLVQLLDDPSISVQVSALGVIVNIAVDFKSRKSLFVDSGFVKKLVQLAKSMDGTLRLNAVWALRNLVFRGDRVHKEGIIKELTASTLTSLICDSESSIQEQALAFLRNLVDGSTNNIIHAFVEDGQILDAIIRQLNGSPSPEVCTQGMLFLSNMAAGDEFHKETIMDFIVPCVENEHCRLFLINFLQSKSSSLRTAALWCIINLIYPECSGSPNRISRLRDAGIISQLKAMMNDPCLDAKHRVRMALELCTVSESKSS